MHYIEYGHMIICYTVCPLIWESSAKAQYLCLVRTMLTSCFMVLENYPPSFVPIFVQFQFCLCRYMSCSCNPPICTHSVDSRYHVVSGVDVGCMSLEMAAILGDYRCMFYSYLCCLTCRILVDVTYSICWRLNQLCAYPYLILHPLGLFAFILRILVDCPQLVPS